MKPRVIARQFGEVERKMGQGASVRGIGFGVEREWEKRKPIVLSRGKGKEGWKSVGNGVRIIARETIKPKYADLFMGEKPVEKKVEVKVESVELCKEPEEKVEGLTEKEERLAEYLGVAETVVNPIVEEEKEPPKESGTEVVLPELGFGNGEETVGRKRRRGRKRHQQKELG